MTKIVSIRKPAPLANPPAEPYQVILADCPWFYNERKNPDTKFGLGANYPLMKTEDLCAMQVGVGHQFAAKDSILFFWVTAPRLPDGIKVIEAWGFRYATIGFTWVKPYEQKRAYTEQDLVYGPGYYTGSNVELCLIGVKGSMKPSNRGIRQVIVEPRPETRNGKVIHSRKPARIRDTIAHMYAEYPRKVELFSRETSPSWDSYGFDSDGTDLTELFKRVS